MHTSPAKIRAHEHDMNAIRVRVARRHIALRMPLVIRDRLALYLYGRYEPHSKATRERARGAYLRATGRA